MPHRRVNEIRLVEMLSNPRTRFEVTACGCAAAPGPHTFIKPRRIDEHLIHYNVQGCTEARVAGRQLTVSPGSLLWVQPGAEHEVHLPEGRATVEFVRFRFGADRCPRIRKGCVLCKSAPWARLLLEELHPARGRVGPLESFRRRSILVRLMCEILQYSSAVSAVSDGLQPHQQRRCLEFIHENLSRRYPVFELARHCQLNAAYLAMQFRKSFAITPQLYIKQARIRAAAGMLQETGKTISQVAYELGYSDVYFFSRQFAQVMGLSPRNWRSKRLETRG
jgi:AraC-like DNA-binding protein